MKNCLILVLTALCNLSGDAKYAEVKAEDGTIDLTKVEVGNFTTTTHNYRKKLVVNICSIKF